jgi:hypothetical protein
VKRVSFTPNNRILRNSAAGVTFNSSLIIALVF